MRNLYRNYHSRTSRIHSEIRNCEFFTCRAHNIIDWLILVKTLLTEVDMAVACALIGRGQSISRGETIPEHEDTVLKLSDIKPHVIKS